MIALVLVGEGTYIYSLARVAGYFLRATMPARLAAWYRCVSGEVAVFPAAPVAAGKVLVARMVRSQRVSAIGRL